MKTEKNTRRENNKGGTTNHQKTRTGVTRATVAAGSARLGVGTAGTLTKGIGNGHALEIDGSAGIAQNDFIKERFVAREGEYDWSNTRRLPMATESGSEGCQ